MTILICAIFYLFIALVVFIGASIFAGYFPHHEFSRGIEDGLSLLVGGFWPIFLLLGAAMFLTDSFIKFGASLRVQHDKKEADAKAAQKARDESPNPFHPSYIWNVSSVKFTERKPGKRKTKTRAKKAVKK